MNKLVELGFQARRNFQESVELDCYRAWCRENNLKSDETFTAEILWEINLSKLKSKKVKIPLCY